MTQRSGRRPRPTRCWLGPSCSAETLRRSRQPWPPAVPWSPWNRSARPTLPSWSIPGPPRSTRWATSSARTSNRRRRPSRSPSWSRQQTKNSGHRCPRARIRVPRLARTAALEPGAVDVRLLTMTPRLDGLRDDLRPIGPAGRSSLSPTWRCTSPTSLRATGSARGCSGPRTPTPRRRRCSIRRTRPAVPWESTRRASSSSPPGRVTVSTNSPPGSPSTCNERRCSPPRRRRRRTRPQPSPMPAPRSSLVEGEPLANALSGYAWWEAEGHGGRIAAVLVDAACGMAALACEAGLFDLARWGLEQARIVEPYSEALSRSAMQVAAAEGDADRLRLEWRECQRRVDALDPGGSPSARTETLYGELSRQVLVGAALPTARPRTSLPAATDD